MDIRAEKPNDIEAIQDIITSAFGQKQEARLVDDLRNAGDLKVSLVASIDGKPYGYIALSRLKSPSNALALAPVAVTPSRQKEGIGAALVQEALGRAKACGCKIIFVLGDPDYYSRFGFSLDQASSFQSPYSGPYFMAQYLTDEKVAPVEVIYADAFDMLE